MHPTYKKWLDDECPKVICECGCQQEIVENKWWKQNGIPKYINGHGKKGKIYNIHETYKKWLDDGCPKVFCHCGCNEEIVVKEFWKYNGIPKYISGHNLKNRIRLEDEIKRGTENLKKWYNEHPEVKIKKQLQMLGDNNPAKRSEVKEKIANANRNRIITQESREKNRQSNLSSNNHFYGKHHTKESIEKMSKSHENKQLGSDNPNWKGGISFEPYCPKFNKKLKEEIRDRDNHICQLCGKIEEEYNRKLSIHHIHYDKKNCYPDLITLCVSCNSKVNGNRKYWEEYFMKILKEKNLLNYFEEVNK